MASQVISDLVLTSFRPCIFSIWLLPRLGWVPSWATQFCPDTQWRPATGIGLAFCGLSGCSSGDQSLPAFANRPQQGGAF